MVAPVTKSEQVSPSRQTAASPSLDEHGDDEVSNDDGDVDDNDDGDQGGGDGDNGNNGDTAFNFRVW